MWEEQTVDVNPEPFYHLLVKLSINQRLTKGNDSVETKGRVFVFLQLSQHLHSYAKHLQGKKLSMIYKPVSISLYLLQPK